MHRSWLSGWNESDAKRQCTERSQNEPPSLGSNDNGDLSCPEGLNQAGAERRQLLHRERVGMVGARQVAVEGDVLLHHAGAQGHRRQHRGMTRRVVREADRRAELVARELGRDGFRIVRIGINTAGRGPGPMYRERLSAAQDVAAPTIEAGEITDKGYINQGAVLSHRAELVEKLHAENDDAAIVRLHREPAE